MVLLDIKSNFRRNDHDHRCSGGACALEGAVVVDYYGTSKVDCTVTLDVCCLLHQLLVLRVACNHLDSLGLFTMVNNI